MRVLAIFLFLSGCSLGARPGIDTWRVFPEHCDQQIKPLGTMLRHPPFYDDGVPELFPVFISPTSGWSMQPADHKATDWREWEQSVTPEAWTARLGPRVVVIPDFGMSLMASGWLRNELHIYGYETLVVALPGHAPAAPFDGFTEEDRLNPTLYPDALRRAMRGTDVAWKIPGFQPPNELAAGIAVGVGMGGALAIHAVQEGRARYAIAIEPDEVALKAYSGGSLEFTRGAILYQDLGNGPSDAVQRILDAAAPEVLRVSLDYGAARGRPLICRGGQELGHQVAELAHTLDPIFNLYWKNQIDPALEPEPVPEAFYEVFQ